MLRRIGIKGDQKVQFQELIKQVDAFPKVEDSYVRSNSFGGLVTLLCWGAITLLLYSEVNEFIKPNMEYKYTVDNELDTRLAINIDLTVAMPCNLVGADVLDIWGREIGNTEQLSERLVPFELAENQKTFLKLQGAQERMKGIGQAHASLEDMMGDTSRKLVPRDDRGPVLLDACQIHGSIPINKVKGNFHILSGRHVNIPGLGHAHLQFGDVQKNFSHRIDGLTFGDRVHGMMYALDGEEKIAPTRDYSFQYYVQIVPTKYINEEMNVQTYQYTVQEQLRAVGSGTGNHGNAGIVIKYEFSPISAIVQIKDKNWVIFATRLLGVVGGIISTSGLLNLVITETFDWLCCSIRRSRPAKT